MNLYVIGNGFDKAHGIKTDYIDFRDFLYNNHPDFLASFEETYGNCLESNRELVEASLWKDFETNLCSIAEDEIVDGATSLKLGLDGGDIDVEDTMMEYWNEQYKFILRLQDYLREWVESISISVPVMTDYIHPIYDGEDDVTDDMFLTFNYTMVLEELYKISPDNICHIHGAVANRKQRLVIGHGDKENSIRAKEKMHEAREQYDDKRSSIYHALAEYYERTKKDVATHIENNRYFFGNLRDIQTVYIAGHSLGEVDIPYFSEILKRTSHDTQWVVVLFNPNSQAYMESVLLKIDVKKDKISMMDCKQFYNR